MAAADDQRRMVKLGITFRVFVSSTFRDFAAERNALQEHVWPRLRELCRKHGARLQAIDLRWGVSEEAGRDQRTMDVCLAEIRRCQQVTPRPNFVVLMGDRYGWRSGTARATLCAGPVRPSSSLGRRKWPDGGRLRGSPTTRRARLHTANSSISLTTKTGLRAR